MQEHPTIHEAAIMAAGMLVFEAQRVEEGLKNALILWDLIHGRITSEEDAQRRIEDRTAVSRFVRTLHDEQLLSLQEFEQCTVALNERNRVVHRLIREEGQLLASPAGRREFFRIITSAIDQVVLAGRVIGDLVARLAPAAGFDILPWHSRETSGWAPGTSNETELSSPKARSTHPSCTPRTSTRLGS